MIEKKHGRKNNGGRRDNSGRPKGPETETISFRVRSDFKDRIKKACEQLIKNYYESILGHGH